MKMVHILIAAVATSAAIGTVRSLAPTPANASSPVATTVAEAVPAPAEEAAEAPATGSIEGQVLELIEVPSYTYCRVGAPGTAGTWIAVPSSPIAVGDHVRVRDGMKMSDFKSTSLKRTFPEIYFGTLDTGPAAHGAPAPRAGADPHGGADPNANGADPHAGIAGAAPGAEVKRVDRAPGPNGKTVAEVIGQRTQLSGKTVRIRATVVKSTPGILGHTYLHLRDGSGAAGTNDLAATTQATPAVGDVVMLEGVVAIDRDIGSGYKFPTIVEDAKVVTP